MPPRIRLAAPADGAALAEIYAPAVRERATSFELEAPGADEMARRVARLTERTPWLACEHRGAVVGYAYASPHRDRPAYQWSVEVSAYVHPDVQRAGVARALYTSLFAVLTRQGYRNAYAGITLPNDASVALHRALGFTDVGVYGAVGYKLGAWHDVAWLARGLAPHTPDAAPPVPLRALCGEAELESLLAEGLPHLRLGGAAPGGSR